MGTQIDGRPVLLHGGILPHDMYGRRRSGQTLPLPHLEEAAVKSASRHFRFRIFRITKLFGALR